jgi:hypothetical protein
LKIAHGAFENGGIIPAKFNPLKADAIVCQKKQLALIDCIIKLDLIEEK